MFDPTLLSQLGESQLEHLPIYYFSKNESGTYIGCNDFMAQVLGFNKGADILGCTDFDLAWTDSASALRNNDEEVIKSAKSKTFLELGRLAHGKISSALSYKWPLQLQSKKIAGIMCISIPFDKDILHIQSPVEVVANEHDLTKRQKDCLYYLGKGMTIKEIGHTLGISARTVEHYIEALKIKLGCNSRSQLVGKIYSR